MRLHFCFLLLCIAFIGAEGTAYAVSDIQVSEERAPDVNVFGITAKNQAALTLDDTSITALMRLANGVGKQALPDLEKNVLGNLIAAPELPNQVHVPDDWMIQRLRMLRIIGKPDVAWNLFSTIPPSLMTEPIAREGVITAWIMSKTEAACGLVAQYIDMYGNTYWTQQQLACALLKNSQPQVEFSLQLLEETAPKDISPVLKSIAENSVTLPTLTSKDADVIAPLGVYLRQNAHEASGSRAIPVDFIDQMPLSVLPADLLAWAAQFRVIPLAKRCDAAETAYLQDVLNATALRQVYQEVLSARAADASMPPYCTRAAILAQIGSAANPTARTSALSQAYETLRQSFTDGQTRALLIEEFRELSGRLPDPSAPTFLLLQAALAHIEQGDRQAAERIGDELASRRTMQGRVGAYAVRQAIARSFTNSYDTTPPDISDLPMPDAQDKAETIWHRVRIADVLEALNYPLPPTVRSNQFAAPMPPASPINIDLLNQFQQAKLDGNRPAALLYGMTLLQSARLDMTGSSALGQVIAMLNSYGMQKETNILVTESLLTPPH
ncbi:MAG: hypothetical protein U1E36_01495 [Rickettsiales bacterium]